eukprot:4671216-Amphidinium_carterae.4
MKVRVRFVRLSSSTSGAGGAGGALVAQLIGAHSILGVESQPPERGSHTRLHSRTTLQQERLKALHRPPHPSLCGHFKSHHNL